MTSFKSQPTSPGLMRLRGTLAEQKAALEIRRVASTAAMSALTGLANGETVDADGYYASGDGGGQNFVYRSTGRSSIVIDSVFFFVGSGSVDYFESLDKSVVYGKRAGIKADGTTNDAARLQAALNATQLGYTSILDLQTGVISLTSEVSLTVLTNLTICGNGATLKKDGTIFNLGGDEEANLTLAATVANRSTTITVSSASNVSVGDIVCIYSNDAVETAWNYKANDTRKVVKITGNVLTMDSEANFDYTTGDMVGVGKIRHWKKNSVVIEKLNFVSATDTPGNGCQLWVNGGVSGQFNDISFIGNNNATDAMRLWYCVNVQINRTHIARHLYGIELSFCRFINIYDTLAVNCIAHPIVPASWTSHTVINGLILENSEAGIDSHPAIYVTYENVTQANAKSPNCRALGVTLRNCKFTMAAAPPIQADIGPGYPSFNARYNYLLTQFDIVLDHVTYLPPPNGAYDPTIIIACSFRKLVVESCSLSGLRIEGYSTEGVSIHASRLGYLTQRFTGNQSLHGVEFDWSLQQYYADPTRIHLSANKVSWVDVRCLNYPSTGTLFGYCWITNFTAVNCDFGLLEDLASNRTGKPKNYLFANSTMEFTNDNEFGVDLSRFVNCRGSIAGQPLDDIGNSYANFDGTTDFATLPEFSIGDGTKGTVLARVRYNGSTPTTSGPFNFIYNSPFYYVYPATTNIWCGELRQNWVANFTANAGVPKTDWHWIVIRTNAASGWEFLQATDAGVLSSRATAAHENFTTNNAYGIIGKNRSGSDFWGGDIDRLIALPERLSDVQIQTIIAGGVGVGASLRYEFADIVNGRFIDSSVNGVDATITSSPDIIPLGGSLTVAEVDGTPSDDIWKLIVPNGSLVIVDGVATLTVGGGGIPTAITVADEATDTTCFVGFFTGATGNLAPKTNAGLTFNSATGALGATTVNAALNGTLGTGTPTAATVTTLTASGSITGSNLSGTNTGDQNLSSYATQVYVDNAVIGLLDSKGPINCSTNPNYPASLKGDLYHVTVAGKIGGASGIDVEVGDAIVASADNAGGTHTSVGSSWYILEHNLNGAVLVGGALGTPSSGNLANCTFPTLNQSTTGNAATVTTNANLTGHVTSVGNAAVLGAFTKAQLDTAVSDGNVLYVGDVTTNAMHTGDATGSTALTLATVNSNVGLFGSETQASIITVNAKGLVTAASASTITPAVASITGFGTGVATALAIAVGSAGGPVVNGGAIGSASYTAVRTTLIANVIADNAATITLGSGNLQSMSLVAATGAVTINFVMPTSAATGTIVLLQDDTARDVTWTSTGGGTILWAGTQPTWASDTVSSYRLLPWLYDGTRLIIGPTEICVANS